jgi:hypothetical protein
MGYIQLSIHGARESRGGVQAARFDENSVGFVWAEREPFEAIRDYLLRARAGRSGDRAPAVGPFDEFDGDHECDGEGDLVESVMDEAVGVAA